MSNVKGALFAGIAVSFIALAFNAFLENNFTVEARNAESSEKESRLDKINQKAQHLEERIESLIQESGEKIEQYQELYDELYHSELRLSYKHITYSSRLVANEERYIKNSLTINTTRESPLSLDLRTASAITAYEIDEYVLKDTLLSGLGEAFVQAELDHGVNALFLVSLGIHESGWGKSDIAKYKNNLFGFKAYDSSPFESAASFATKQEGIDRVARHLKENYLSDDGQYHSGFTLSHVNKRYASDKGWASKIAGTMDDINKKIIDQQDTDYHLEQYATGEDDNGDPIYSYAFSAVVE